MAYPSKVDKETIIVTAGEWVERYGADKLSLNKLAKSFDIKTPSLYRYVGGRDDLLREVNLRTIEQLIDTLKASIVVAEDEDAPTPSHQLVQIMQAHRNFIHSNPNRYRLVFNGIDSQRPNDELLVQLVLPIQAVVAELVGATPALTVLRGAMALVHGFSLLEINQVLRRGGDLASDFEKVVDAYVAGCLWIVVDDED